MVKASLALCLCVIQLVPEVIVITNPARVFGVQRQSLHFHLFMVDLLWNVALLIRAQMNKKNTWRR